MSIDCQASCAWKTPGLVMWRQFDEFWIALVKEKCRSVIGDEIGNIGECPKLNRFNQNLSIVKIFINITIILVAIKDRFHLQ